MFRPGSAGFMTEVRGPVIAGALVLTALFVRQRKVEVRVRVRWQGFDGLPQMFDGFVEMAQLVEDAAQVEMSDAVGGVKGQRRPEGAAGLVEPAKVI